MSWNLLAFLSFQIIYSVILKTILLIWWVPVFPLHCLWIYCITICQLQVLMFILLHCIVPVHTAFEYSKVKKRWEWVSFSFLHNMHVCHNGFQLIQSVTSWQSTPWIASQVTNKHYGGAGLLHVIFIQLTLTKSPLKALYIRLIEKLACWNTSPLTLEKVFAPAKTFFTTHEACGGTSIRSTFLPFM